MSNSVSEINESTVFGMWYGKDMFDRDVSIEDDNLLKFLSEMSKVEGVEGHDSDCFKGLLEHALKENHIQLPDGARFVRTLSAAKEKEWMDIYQTLSLAIETNKG
jgi:hypothetical protein